jgi:hypothetical protein
LKIEESIFPDNSVIYTLTRATIWQKKKYTT